MHGRVILGPLSTPCVFIVELLRDQLVHESLAAQRAVAQQVRARVSHTGYGLGRPQPSLEAAKALALPAAR